jgi:hypothetical protein
VYLLGHERKMKEEKKEMIIADTTPISRVHTPLIMKEKMKRNQLRQWKKFFDCQKPPHASPNMRGSSNMLVLVIHAATTFQLKTHYFKGELRYYPRPHLQ